MGDIGQAGERKKFNKFFTYTHCLRVIDVSFAGDSLPGFRNGAREWLLGNRSTLYLYSERGKASKKNMKTRQGKGRVFELPDANILGLQIENSVHIQVLANVKSRNKVSSPIDTGW